VTAPAGRPADFWIGTHRGGLYPLRHVGGQWSSGDPYPQALSASFGVCSPLHDLQYLVDERDDGAVGIYRKASSGWTRLARVAVRGDAPCHLALSSDQTRLAVANYSSGSVTLFLLDHDGIPVAPGQVFAATGSGPDRTRQTGPHAHWVGFDAADRWLYAVDLGSDAIHAVAMTATGGEVLRTAFKAPPGSGPRHLLLHPRRRDIAYLACELANTLMLLSGGDGVFTAIETLSTLPAGFGGPSIVAHLAINAAGDRLYVSNREHDSIAVFALDDAGTPRLIQHAPVGAAYPRHFLLLEDEACLIVANEKDECVTVLPIESNGMLGRNVARVAVPGAAFVLRA
jgi:6-phosphogluconolactonase